MLERVCWRWLLLGVAMGTVLVIVIGRIYPGPTHLEPWPDRISGVVWQEKSNPPNCEFNAGIDSPLQGANVALSGATGPSTKTTGADGVFGFENVAAGATTLQPAATAGAFTLYCSSAGSPVPAAGIQWTHTAGGWNTDQWFSYK